MHVIDDKDFFWLVGILEGEGTFAGPPTSRGQPIVRVSKEPHRGRGLCHKHYMMWLRDRASGRETRIVPLR